MGENDRVLSGDHTAPPAHGAEFVPPERAGRALRRVAATWHDPCA